MNLHCKAFLTILASLACVQTAYAAEAGSVIFARGSVTAEREPPIALAKGDAVLEQDTIATGTASRAQLLMLDGAKIAVRPESRLVIEEYAYQAPAAATVTTRDDKSVMNLVKGGFRTITGAIGKEDPSAYEVRTPVGVLGIRGTDYSAVFCRGDCAWAPGVTPGAPVEDGLYLGVVEGTIWFRTPAETIEVAAGGYAFIPLATQRPEMLDTPPPVLLDDNDLRFQAGQAGSRPGDSGREPSAEAPGFDSALGTRRGAPATSSPQAGDGEEPADESGTSTPPAQPQIAIDPDGNPIDITPGGTPAPGNRTIGYSSGQLGGTIDPVFSNTTQNDPTQYQLDASFNLERFDSTEIGRVGARTVSFDIGTSSNVESGFDSMTVLRWGRWSGGSAAIMSGGSTEQVDLGSQSIHWIQSPDTAPPVMPITGTATYSLVGGTSPTDTLGNTGVLGDASFFADFTNMRVDSTLSIDIAGSLWSAAGQGTIGAQALLPAHLFSGFYSVDVDGIGGGAGTFTGFFSEPGETSDPAIPGGVGLSYSLQDAQGATTVSGTAAFGNP